jgi:prepilin peptidase CpaA
LIARFALGGWNEGHEALMAVAVAFLLFFPLYAVKAVAAGDAKLLMAMGAWMTTKVVIEVAAIAILVGASVGLVTLLRRKGFKGSLKSIADNVAQGAPTRTAVKMPFGPAFFCAYLVVSVAQARHWELL